MSVGETAASASETAPVEADAAPAPPEPQPDPTKRFCVGCGASIDFRSPRCIRCGAAQGAPARPPPARKSKAVAAVLAFFLGGFGVHRFYLGQWGWGLVYLLFFWTLIPGLVALVDFIVILATSDERFQEKHAGKGIGGGALVAVVVVVVFGGLVVVGALAAIAIPNFIRYQHRARTTEAHVLLRAIDTAEAARGPDAGYVAFPHPLPEDGAPGPEKLAWSEADAEVAADVGFAAPAATWARYDVAVATDPEGRQALSLCAELDLDGDGELQAIVLHRPALEDGAVVLAPPPAPCRAEVLLADGASLEYADGDAIGVPVTVSPVGVF
jgi:TM2 domain-containing membrane protein YozV/Tfp pilus assembly protein PilE